jgi:hypothetical protein
MAMEIVIRGTYAERTFIPNGPLPDATGSAELIVRPEANPTDAAPKHSSWDAVGKLPPEQQRSAEDIDAQIREERESWGDR